MSRCTICNSADFHYSEQWKNYRCSKCNSAPRQRRIHYIIKKHLSDLKNIRVHEFAPMNQYIESQTLKYTSSQWYPDQKFGLIEDKKYNEDIQNLTFQDQEVDLFLAEDVFEHIFSPECAISELKRCLTKGGMALITVPLEGLPGVTQQCALLNDNNEIINLKSPRFHGAPAGSGKSLVVWEYGLDFVELVRKWLKGSYLEFYFGEMPEYEILNDRRATFLFKK